MINYYYVDKKGVGGGSGGGRIKKLFNGERNPYRAEQPGE